MVLFQRLRMLSLGRATEWLNSEPLGPAELRGHVVLVNFWTLTCINWLRTRPYVRAWAEKYKPHGLLVIGVHTPEFAVEQSVDNVRRRGPRGVQITALKERQMDQETNEWQALIRKANQLFRATIHPAALQLPIEGVFPSLGGATEWLNSQPSTAVSLLGHVVLINFWTYTCINWLRTLPYVRAWAEKYKPHGLVVIGVHTPEFAFERNVDNVRRAAQDMHIDYPIAVDSDYAIWTAFDNHYWPAFYFVDAQGHIRHHQFGEGQYEQSEMILQQLLAEAGIGGISHELVSIEGSRVEAAADWGNLRSPENYLGYERTENFASPGGALLDTRHVYAAPEHLRLNQWALAGDWTVGRQATVLNTANGKIVYRFHARDLHLVMGPAARGTFVQFRVLVDGQPPGAAHGSDVDEQGNGTLSEQRLYQLIRHPQPIADRLFEIAFLDPGVEAYAFTFG